MKKGLFLFALTTAALFTSCSMANPTACSVVPTTGKIGTSVTFSSCSTSAHHEEWDFGDAATTTGTAVTHAYNTAGSYTVKLTALNEAKTKSDVVTKTIVISQ
ncbi:MAG: hypothetical protein RIS64_4245 [Bacteroidota bacterium]|jgi:PKD repeat protein